MKLDISIIIFAPEISQVIKDCIDNITKFTSLSYEIIVLYTGSIKKNMDKLRRFSNVRCLECSHMNIGSAYNHGFKKAKAPNIVLLSSLASVNPSWDIDIVDCSKLLPSIGLVGTSKKAITTPTNEDLSFHIKESLEKDCLLIKKTVIDTIGGFDETFSSLGFILDDFFLRARFSGFELLRCFKNPISSSYNAHMLENIDYLEEYTKDRKRFVEKWKDYIPIKNDIISEILCRIPTTGEDDILFLGDNLIIPNTLERRGYKLSYSPRAIGYQTLSSTKKKYSAIILFDNMTHERTLIKLLEDVSALLKPGGTVMINIQNSLFIERIQHIFKGNFSIATFEDNLKYPLFCLTKPEIVFSGEFALLDLTYLIGFASKPAPRFQKLFKEICNTNPSSSSLQEELCIEEYLAIWQKSQFRV